MFRLSLVSLFVFLLCHFASADGGVSGVVELDSQRPPAVSAGYKPLTVKPIQSEDRTPAIVWVERVGMVYPRTRAGEHIRIVQRGYQFRPAVIAVQTGARAEFPNMDDEFHNVLSYTKICEFDLGRFAKGTPSAQVSFTKPGLVKVYCEIHQHMRCRIMVLDTPWFTLTDEQGRFSIKGIPPGEYQIKAMLPSEKTVKHTITIRDGQTTPVQISR